MLLAAPGTREVELLSSSRLLEEEATAYRTSFVKLSARRTVVLVAYEYDGLSCDDATSPRMHYI